MPSLRFFEIKFLCYGLDREVLVLRLHLYTCMNPKWTTTYRVLIL